MDGHNMIVSLRTWNDLTEQLEQQRMELERLKKDRRERIATAILAGMWANPEVWKEWLPAKTRMRALAEADALIKALDREEAE